ncbi:MAG: 4-hydroxy-tetrahydrodipicolinate synthase, partial [Planctomycetota bacterium]|nr:4-hydroxy-tetrahydrodipicolinate synthase [Planctomycetota bacterium]
MLHGCFTAVVTPMTPEFRVDMAGLEKLVEFQVAQGVSGVLAVGTTGESPTLSWGEHNRVVERVCSMAKGRATSIAGTGSNNTEEALRATEHAADAGADAALLVDPYYNGPSSLEIRREYVSPVAAAFPGIDIIPYIIPGRSGTQLLPEDVAMLKDEHTNVRTVKEATGSLDNAARTRECCGDEFSILSGDDSLALEMMADERIRGGGVVSVMSNVVPGAMQRMCDAQKAGDAVTAQRIRANLAPLFSMCGVKTMESTPYGDRSVNARNPLPLKMLMNILGMPAGPCRRPLGKMTRNGVRVVLENARKVHENDPTLFAPVADF